MDQTRLKERHSTNRGKRLLTSAFDDRVVGLCNQLIDDGRRRFALFEMSLDCSSWHFRQNKSGASYLTRTCPAESIARKPAQTFLEAIRLVANAAP